MLRAGAATQHAGLSTQDSLQRALAGEPLGRDAAYDLVRAPTAELPRIMAAAGALRDRGKGRVVTYSRKVFVPLTNLCRDKCGYCTFAKAPRHPEARTLDPDDVLAIATAGAAQGCKEALFSLGEKPEERYALARAQLERLGYPTTIAYLAAMGELVFERTGLLPHANCGVMTRDELLQLREYNGSMGLMLESVSERLLQRGGAHFGCVGKAPATRLDTMAAAGELGIAFTTGILIGIGETPEERVDSLFAIKELHRRYGHIQEVIIQNFRVKPDIRMRHWPEPSLVEMLQTIAVARLILGAEMNIQAPPNLAEGPGARGQGPGEDLAARLEKSWGAGGVSPDPWPLAPDPFQAYLHAGINDWGGVSPVTRDHINPERPWPHITELRERSTRAGFQLRERLCLYPEYVGRPEYVRPRLREAMLGWVDDRGMVAPEAEVE